MYAFQWNLVTELISAEVKGLDHRRLMGQAQIVAFDKENLSKELFLELRWYIGHWI